MQKDLQYFYSSTCSSKSYDGLEARYCASIRGNILYNIMHINSIKKTSFILSTISSHPLSTVLNSCSWNHYERGKTNSDSIVTVFVGVR